MANNNPRSRKFDVPTQLLAEFFTATDEYELEIELVEIPDPDTLCVEVSYHPSQRDVVMNLIELIDEYEQEEDDDENDD
ncbi:MAG: hypothetical protein K1X81_13995 [Bacteroidia bacterium]|nr:hypothetical protein [Bacteroidia bacterium]